MTSILPAGFLSAPSDCVTATVFCRPEPMPGAPSFAFFAKGGIPRTSIPLGFSDIGQRDPLTSVVLVEGNSRFLATLGMTNNKAKIKVKGSRQNWPGAPAFAFFAKSGIPRTSIPSGFPDIAPARSRYQLRARGGEQQVPRCARNDKP